MVAVVAEFAIYKDLQMFYGTTNPVIKEVGNVESAPQDTEVAA